MKSLRYRKLDGEECPNRTPTSSPRADPLCGVSQSGRVRTLLYTESFPLAVNLAAGPCQDFRVFHHIDVPKLTAGILLMDGIQTVLQNIVLHAGQVYTVCIVVYKWNSKIENK